MIRAIYENGRASVYVEETALFIAKECGDDCGRSGYDRGTKKERRYSPLSFITSATVLRRNSIRSPRISGERER